MEYDPILAKLIVHAHSREACRQRMIRALHDYVILGVLTPIPFLVDILSTEAFARGETYTDFIETHFPDWQPGTRDASLVGLSYVIGEIAGKGAAHGAVHALAEAYSPWKNLGHFRP
jgi:acetyl-CoA carboxylase biotin carboxylase subunit